MKQIKRICALALACALSFNATAFAALDDTGYTDVDADAWYADAVSYVTDNGLMGGTSSTAFSPEDAMTRSMLATVLYRAAESPAVTGSDDFTDTADGTWYTDAVLWATATARSARTTRYPASRSLPSCGAMQAARMHSPVRTSRMRLRSPLMPRTQSTGRARTAS